MHRHYRDAGYHEQNWNTPKASSKLVGIHDTADGEIVVEHLAEGPSGLPEFKIAVFAAAGGAGYVFQRAVTVVCEDVARAYLDQFGATGKSRRRKARGEVPHIDLGHWKERQA